MFTVLRKRCTSLFSLKSYLNPERKFSVTSTSYVKQIIETQEGKTLVIEGVIGPSPREKLLVQPESESKACPLCRLNLNVKHTDVLILSQFVRQNGTMLPKRITGLCNTQQKRVSTMVKMAHKSGLMGKFKPPNSNLDPRHRREWKKWNTYFDEATIKPPNFAVYMRYQKKIQDFKDSQKESKSLTE